MQMKYCWKREGWNLTVFGKSRLDTGMKKYTYSCCSNGQKVIEQFLSSQGLNVYHSSLFLIVFIVSFRELLNESSFCLFVSKAGAKSIQVLQTKTHHVDLCMSTKIVL